MQPPDTNIIRINLSLSSVCSADCIFCPSSRGKQGAKEHMSVSLVEKLLNDISKDDRHGAIQQFSCGENGDCFVNPSTLDILRLIKKDQPHSQIVIFTNFLTMSRSIAEALIKEKLVDVVKCNIDGYDEQRYRAVKRGSLTKARKNIETFLEIRKEANSRIPLTVHVITYSRYINTILANLNILPSKVTAADVKKNNFDDDFLQIKKLWEPLLDPTIDQLHQVTECVAWAEREQFQGDKIAYKKYVCPMLERIRNQAYIAPDGTWYLCCFDAKNELEIGNIEKNSFTSLMDSIKRRKIISLLEKKQFEKVGGPCLTVNCCELLFLSPIKTRWYRYYHNSPAFLKKALRLGKRIMKN